MGTTRDDGSQPAMWVATADLPQGGGHPFYERLNQILNAAGFDAFVEKLSAPFYVRMGRPSLAPGRYFRLLLVGYFEGLDSERAIAWRAADSLSLPGAADAGRASQRPATRCMPTGAGFAACGAVACCGVEENCWSGRLPTCARQVGCDGSIFEDIPTS